MHRIDSFGATAAETYTNGVPNVTPATVADANAMNAIQEELAYLVERDGGPALLTSTDGVTVKGDPEWTQVGDALDARYGQLAQPNTWTGVQTLNGGAALGADDNVTFAARTQHFVTGAVNFIADQAGVHIISATGEGAYIENVNGSGTPIVITAQLRATPGSTITALEIMADTTGAAVDVDQIYLTAQDALTTADSSGYDTTRVFASNQTVSWGLGDVLKFRAVTLSPPGDATVPASGIVTLRMRLPEPGTAAATIHFHAAKLTTTRTVAALL